MFFILGDSYDSIKSYAKVNLGVDLLALVVFSVLFLV